MTAEASGSMPMPVEQSANVFPSKCASLASSHPYSHTPGFRAPIFPLPRISQPESVTGMEAVQP